MIIRTGSQKIPRAITSFRISPGLGKADVKRSRGSDPSRENREHIPPRIFSSSRNTPSKTARLSSGPSSWGRYSRGSAAGSRIRAYRIRVDFPEPLGPVRAIRSSGPRTSSGKESLHPSPRGMLPASRAKRRSALARFPLRVRPCFRSWRAFSQASSAFTENRSPSKRRRY